MLLGGVTAKWNAKRYLHRGDATVLRGMSVLVNLLKVDIQYSLAKSEMQMRSLATELLMSRNSDCCLCGSQTGENMFQVSLVFTSRFAENRRLNRPLHLPEEA